MENKNVVAVDRVKLYNYINKQDVTSLSNKELVVSMHGLTFMNDHHEFLLGVNTGLTATSVICGLLVSSPALVGVTIGTGLAGVYFAVSNSVKSYKIKKLQNKYADELLRRYGSFTEAYAETAKAILSVEREDLLEFFKKAEEAK